MDRLLYTVGGPLVDDTDKIHALHVYMKGDGRHSIGWYECEGNVFRWHPINKQEDDDGQA